MRVGPPKYMMGRVTAEAELETDLGTTPFESYSLYRGQKYGGDEGEGDYRAVGRFKVTRNHHQFENEEGK